MTAPPTYRRRDNRKNRRSVSMSRQQFERLRILSEKTGRPMAAIVQALVQAAADAEDIDPDPPWRPGKQGTRGPTRRIGGVFEL